MVNLLANICISASQNLHQFSKNLHPNHTYAGKLRVRIFLWFAYIGDTCESEYGAFVKDWSCPWLASSPLNLRHIKNTINIMMTMSDAPPMAIALITELLREWCGSTGTRHIPGQLHTRSWNVSPLVSVCVHNVSTGCDTLRHWFKVDNSNCTSELQFFFHG